VFLLTIDFKPLPMRGIVDAQGSFFLGSAPEKVNINGEERLYENVSVSLGDGHDYENPDFYPPPPEPPKRLSLLNKTCKICRILEDDVSLCA
jgi:hypothetical protein